MKRLLFCTAGLLAALSQAAEPLTGIDRQYIDTAVRPQDDFFRYANGRWLATTEIPPDRPSWGTFTKLRDDTTSALLLLIEAAQKDPQRKAGSDSQKLGDLYTSFMDVERLEALGYKPLTGELQRIRQLRDARGIPALTAHLAQIGVATPYAVSVSQDARDARQYAVHLSQSGLGMPERDYYLKTDDARLSEARMRYLALIEQTFALINEPAPKANAAIVLALETELARLHWTRVENRDPLKRYNKMVLTKLADLAPGYDWHSAMAAAGVSAKTSEVIVSQPSYLIGYAKLAGSIPLASWQAYFKWQLMRAYAPYLSRDFVDAHHAFYGKVLGGATENRERWKLGVAAVDSALGDMLGKRYAAAYFPPERKARMEAMVAKLMQAYRDSIAKLDWMGTDTRQQALAKLAKVSAKIGYPDKWRDYSTLVVSPRELAGNVMRAHLHVHARMMGRLSMPVEHAEWNMTPQTVNASYAAVRNEIVFPAAILQPPLFDASADDAVNYGAIGAVIGHEISHGFDDEGSQSDGDGNLRDWWSVEDRARFNTKAAALVAQYGAYSPLAGYRVNGELTLGENIADNAGLLIAYKAYQLSLDGQPAPVMDGWSGAQRFYLGFARLWRRKDRDAHALNQLNTDPHAPAQFRTNGTLRNQDGFHAAFDVKQGDPMYLAPSARINLW